MKKHFFMDLFQKYSYSIKKLKREKLSYRLVLSGALIVSLTVIATLVGMVLRAFGLHEANVVMTYLLAVLMASYLEEGLFNSFVSSFLVVIVYNFFFTEPVYTFQVSNAEHWITFVFMYIAAVSMSTLTMKFKKEAKISRLRERRTYLLYHMSDRLVRASNKDEIRNVAGEDVSKFLKISVVIALTSDKSTLEKPVLYREGQSVENWETPSHQFTSMLSVFERQISSKVQGQFLEDMNMYYVPIVGTHKTLGVIGFCILDGERINSEKSELGTAIATQMAIAIEREDSYEQRSNLVIHQESEALKLSLLRSISQGLKKPIGNILNTLDRAQKDSTEANITLIDAIQTDTLWLNHVVDNIISLTQIDEGKITINKRPEFVKDLMLEVMERMRGITEKHEIELVMPEALIITEMDGYLFKQVLFNLIDNAVKNSSAGTPIQVSCMVRSNDLVVTVVDSGKGLGEESIERLFNRFYMVGDSNGHSHPGIGLGLEICKVIVEMHAGYIKAYNNAEGGATFEFAIPMNDDKNE